MRGSLRTDAGRTPLGVSGHSGLGPILPSPEAPRDVVRRVHRAGGKMRLRPGLASVISGDQEGVGGGAGGRPGLRGSE